MWDLALLVLGLGGLWLGTHTALGATIALGERHGLSPVFLGLTVLAIGTDLPELIVAIDGALFQLRGIDASGVVVGNAIGSAIAQGGLVQSRQRSLSAEPSPVWKAAVNQLAGPPPPAV